MLDKLLHVAIIQPPPLKNNYLIIINSQSLSHPSCDVITSSHPHKVVSTSGHPHTVVITSVTPSIAQVTTGHLLHNSDYLWSSLIQ